MKTIQVTRYECEWCGKQYESQDICKYHEKREHMCPSCKHVWWLYGAEMNCELKRCSYTPNDKKEIDNGC